MSSATVKTRFAPSPTGLLHLGNVRTALFNHLLAGASDGVFLLRLEDTDAERSDESHVKALQEDLHWLGLDWQEGPGMSGENGPYVQSQRSDIYNLHYEKLSSSGKSYPCFCTEHELKLSRKMQTSAGKPPRYNGKCRNLTDEEVKENIAADKPATLRFRVPQGRTIKFEDKVRGPQQFVTDDIGDFIIRRSNGTPAFFFCNAVDDALMGVTLVARGEDHLSNTPRQLMILEALELSAPEYAHIALVVGDDGAPLSKRNGSQTVAELREQGFLPAAIINYLARLGHSYESNDFMAHEQLADAFQSAKLHRAPARFDAAQLMYWQREAVANTSDKLLWMWADSAAVASTPLSDLVAEDKRERFINTIRQNISMPSDVYSWAANLFAKSGVFEEVATEAIREAGADFFDAALTILSDGKKDFKDFSKRLGGNTDKKGKALFMPLRAALSGETDQTVGMENRWHDGPQLGSIWALLDDSMIQRRLELARDMAR